MAKKKKHYSPQRIEYEKEYQRLLNRIRYWEKVHRMSYKAPKKATKNYEKATERIKQIRWTNLTKKDKEKAQRNFDIAYEQGKIDIPQLEKPDFTPHTESEFLSGDDGIDNDFWDDLPTEPVNSKEEIDAFIEEKIEEILDTSNLKYYSENMKGIFRSLLDNLRTYLGEEDFYNYLSNPETLSKLTEAAQGGMAFYKPDDSRRGMAGESYNAVLDFARILNNNVPLTPQQSEGLDEIIWSNAYMGSIDFEEGWLD